MSAIVNFLYGILQKQEKKPFVRRFRILFSYSFSVGRLDCAREKEKKEGVAGLKMRVLVAGPAGAAEEGRPEV